MLDTRIGETIRKRRKSLKITQPDLADLAKISVNTLYKIERGEGNPTLDVLEKIAVVLGLELKLEVKQIGK
jgi:transcriptional regulator with XRE-family HTH domain